MFGFLRKQNRRKAPRSERPPLFGEGSNLPWKKVAVIALFFVGALAIGYGGVRLLDRPIRVVAVEGKFQRVSAVQVEHAVTTGLKKGVVAEGLLSVDLVDVQKNVEALPWVDRAVVQRRWPNGLRVEVTEQIAAARWGEAGLLNTRGELFLRDARHVPPELPRLDGPEGSEGQVAQRYLSVLGQMVEAGTQLAALRLDPRGAWEMELANGMQIKLGRRDIDARIDRFLHAAWPLLTARAAEVSYVDMRYSNGFAVGWKNNYG